MCKTYLTGVYALNHIANRDSGDWHKKCLDWGTPDLRPLDWNKTLTNYGIEVYNDELVATTLRALLDLLLDHKFKWLDGFAHEFALNDAEINEFITQARKYNDAEINEFLKSQFGIRFTGGKTPFSDYIRKHRSEI